MPALNDQSRTRAMGGRGEPTLWMSIANIAGGGAPTVDSDQSDPGTTWARTGAGVYNVTFPPALRGKVHPEILKTAAPTVFTAHVTALSVTAGTATIRFNNAAGAATDPASGDIVGFTFTGAGKH
jgi:hypothetical protein